MRAVDGFGARYYRWPLFDAWAGDAVLGVVCRIGGSSAPPLSNMNLGHTVGDTPSALKENRTRVNRLLGVTPETPWAYCNQVHGTRISDIPRFFSSEDSPIPDSDGLLIERPGTVAAVLLADCLPLAVYDPVNKIGVLCHAGWRGTLAGIAAEAVERLVGKGSSRNNLVAAAGPGIGPCCFEVGEQVAELFLMKKELESSVRNDAGVFRIDLEAANLAVLVNAGIDETKLACGGFCTACRPDEFFSYRKEAGVTGRHAAVMALR